MSIPAGLWFLQQCPCLSVMRTSIRPAMLLPWSSPAPTQGWHIQGAQLSWALLVATLGHRWEKQTSTSLGILVHHPRLCLVALPGGWELFGAQCMKSAMGENAPKIASPSLSCSSQLCTSKCNIPEPPSHAAHSTGHPKDPGWTNLVL